MKVLFVLSGNTNPAIVLNQSKSLNELNIDLDLFFIKGKGLTGYIKSIFMLRKVLQNQKYNLIHAHYGLSGIVALLGRSKEKIIVSFMGDDLIGSINSGDKKYKLSSKLIARFNLLLSKYFYDFSIVKSSNLYNIMKSISRSKIIPNGVNLSTFYEYGQRTAKTKLGFNISKKLVLFISNPVRPEKNFELAKTAVKYLNDDTIELIPVYNVLNNKLVHYYNAADCLLLTSFHEGSPNVIKEAMVCNCPIVSTAVGDVEWVIENIEGCYITSFDPKDVAQKIKLALEYGDKIGRTKGRERIIKLGLDSHSVAESIIQIYNEVISGNN